MNSLIVFAKAPVPGRVKTRLCPPLSHEQAARLYTAFVGDVVEGARACGAATVSVAYEPHRDYADLGWLERAPGWLRQEGDDLGARMTHAFARAFEAGNSKVVVIGSDCPDLDPGVLRRAFTLLDRAEVVLGPAEDGGYYLVGLRAPMPRLFARMRWSKSDVLARTIDRLTRHGTAFRLLAERSDIDTFGDLKELSRRLAGGGRRAPRTHAAIRSLIIEDLFRIPVWNGDDPFVIRGGRHGR